MIVREDDFDLSTNHKSVNIIILLLKYGLLWEVPQPTRVVHENDFFSGLPSSSGAKTRCTDIYRFYRLLPAFTVFQPLTGFDRFC